MIAARGSTNHGRLAAFAEDSARTIARRFDRTVAFHAIPGFDAIFCADPSRATLAGVLRALAAALSHLRGAWSACAGAWRRADWC